MSQQTTNKYWVIREQIVADPVTGLTFEFSVSDEGEPTLTLYGDCLVFGNRTIVFQNNGQTIHGETVLPGKFSGETADGDEEGEGKNEQLTPLQRAWPRKPK